MKKAIFLILILGVVFVSCTPAYTPDEIQIEWNEYLESRGQEDVILDVFINGEDTLFVPLVQSLQFSIKNREARYAGRTKRKIDKDPTIDDFLEFLRRESDP